MTWHELPELPKPDTEVLVEYKKGSTEFEVHGKYEVLSYGSVIVPKYAYNSKEEWLKSNVKRWAYIEEE